MALNPTDLFDIRSLLTEEERMIQDAVARFTDEKVIPIIGDAFDQGRFPKELVSEIADMGLLGSSLPEKYAVASGERVLPVCLPVTKKPVVPIADELARNPRARSAKLRACERSTAPHTRMQSER